ncbi:MAG: collagen binding domain-containing protein [Butyricicoccaceae bacterium]
MKIDKETKVPLSGWKFDVYYNDAHLTTVTTNQNGEAMVENLQPGTYRVKETGGDTEHYNMDAGEQTVELVKDQAEIPTLTFANTIKKHFGILKIDSETHKPIEGVTLPSTRTASCSATTPPAQTVVSGSRMQSRALIRRRRSSPTRSMC